MKARLICDDARVLALLLDDGSYIKNPDISMLGTLLFNFKSLDDFKLGRDAGTWKGEYPVLSAVPGTTLAYVTDSLQLVIEDVSPFIPVFESVKTTAPIEEVLTAAEYAQKHNKSVEQIKVFCRSGRLIGAKKIGRDWVIPENTPYPADSRLGVVKPF